MESTFEINTYKFGTDKLYIEIGLVKVWDIEEGEVLDRYEPIFSHYLKWMQEENIKKSDDSFIDFLHYTKKHNDSIVFKKTEFKIDFESGALVDYEIKLMAEIDAVLFVDNLILYAKGIQFWITYKDKQNLQYYYDMN